VPKPGSLNSIGQARVSRSDPATSSPALSKCLRRRTAGRVKQTCKESKSDLHATFRSFSLTAAVVVSLLGLLVLLGWAFDLEVLKRLVRGRVAMNPLTALMFILGGASLGLSREERFVPLARLSARAAALAVAAVGLLRLGTCLTGWDTGVDQFLFASRLGSSVNPVPNRMAPNTALTFVLTGLGLLLLDRETSRGRRPAQYLALAAAVAAMFAVIGYAYGVDYLYNVPSFIPMALPTALSFFVLSLGILCARPARGLMGVVAGGGAGGTMARRLLPAAVAVPALLGGLCLAGERAGYCGFGLGMSLLVATLIVVFSALIGWNARLLHFTDTERERAEEQVHLLNLQLERRLHRLNALRRIDTAITSSVVLGVTLSTLLDQLTSQLGVDAADVLLLDPRTRSLRCAAGRGFLTNKMQEVSLVLGRGVSGVLALDGTPLHLPDLTRSDHPFARAGAMKEEGFVAYSAVPLVSRGAIKGVLEVFHRTPLDVDREWLDFLQALGGQAVIAVESVTLFEDLQHTNTELTVAYDATIEGWSKALDLRDKETEGHSRRVTDMTVRLAREMGVGGEDLVNVRRGALLHDVGKLGIPDSVLLKPGKLTDEEWVLMRRHPTYAHEWLSPIAFLRPALDIPYCHHEKLDGTGYPRGLKGDEIPLAARIFAAVDIWDALRSDRPYRKGWSEDRVLDHIRSLAGTHLEPAVVHAFQRCLGGQPAVPAEDDAASLTVVTPIPSNDPRVRPAAQQFATSPHGVC